VARHESATSRASVVTVREIMKLVERDGWRSVRQTGSHRHYRHPTKPGTVTIPGHTRDDLHPKTQKSILRQAGLARD
jgi:predicted RNA binding protein YcfA (HicA-like mRNA interferase family)